MTTQLIGFAVIMAICIYLGYYLGVHAERNRDIIPYKEEEEEYPPLRRLK